jgi:hypothetical protein
VNCPNVSEISCKYAQMFQDFLQPSSFPLWSRIDNSGFWRQLTVCSLTSQSTARCFYFMFIWGSRTKTTIKLTSLHWDCFRSVKEDVQLKLLFHRMQNHKYQKSCLLCRLFRVKPHLSCPTIIGVFGLRNELVHYLLTFLFGL